MSRNETVHKLKPDFGNIVLRQKIKTEGSEYRRSVARKGKQLSKNTKVSYDIKSKRVQSEKSKSCKNNWKNYDIIRCQNDVSEDDKSSARPEVLSIDSDFGSGNGAMDSPDQEIPPLLHKNNGTNQGRNIHTDHSTEKEKFDTDGRDSISYVSVSADYSYCTPRSNMYVSRVRETSNQGDRKNKEDTQSLHNQQHCHTPAPITPDHNQHKAAVYSQLPVNGVDKCQPLTLSRSDLIAGQDGQASEGYKQIDSFQQNHLALECRQAQHSAKDMDMKYTNFTHMQLKHSLEQIHMQNSARSVSTPFSIASNIYSSCVGNSNVCSLQMPHFNRNANNPVLNSVPHQINSNFPQRSCHPQVPASSNIPHVSKFDAILCVKDDMLQEKEGVILKLRCQLASLQHQVQEGDAALRQVMQTQITSSTNAYCSSAFNSTGVNKKHDIEVQKKIHDLEQLLGKAECKIVDSAETFQSDKIEREEKIKKLEVLLRNKEQYLVDFKKKQKSTMEKLEKYKKRVESLERYLGDLPTIEETNQLKTEIDILGVERENMIVEINVLKDKLEENLKTLKIAEHELEKEKELETQHLKEITGLKEMLVKSEKSKEKLGRTERDELEDLKFQISRLKKEQEDASRLLSGSERRIRQQQQKHKEKLVEMQEKVQEVEDISESLRRELFMKNQTASKVNSAMINLSSQNQQLMEDKLNLQDRVKSLENLRSDFQEESKACLRLQRETYNAVEDLKSVAQVLIQTAQGTDPNISALLGVQSDILIETDSNEQLRNGSSENGNYVDSTVSAEQTNKRLLEVRKLRSDVDQLRTKLSNQYAESIGDNCTTQ